MSLQPLPQAIITASQLRDKAKELILMAEELEASVPNRPLQRNHSVEANDILGAIVKRDRSIPRKRRGGCKA